MQRLVHSFTVLVILLIVIADSTPSFAQTRIKNLSEYSPAPRVFSPMGCRGLGLNGHVHSDVGDEVGAL